MKPQDNTIGLEVSCAATVVKCIKVRNLLIKKKIFISITLISAYFLYV